MPIAALCLLMVQEDAKAVFLKVLDSYAAHKSGQLTIEHQDSSGLFPGHFVQELKWRKDKKFELRVVRQPEAANAAMTRSEPVPNYYCNGKKVVTQWPDGRKDEGPIEAANSTPGWEVTTTPVLSWIMGTANKKYFANPPDGIKVAYALRGETSFEDKPAQLLELTFTLDTVSQVLQVYVSKERDRLLGMKFELNGKKGLIKFQEQKFDVDLPNTLGTVSKG